MKTTILYLLIYIIESLILWWYTSNLFNSKYSKIRNFITLFIGYGFLFLLSFIKSFWTNTIFFTLINFVIILLSYNIKWNVCLFHSIIITSIMSLSEMTIIGLFSQFTNTAISIHPNIKIMITVTLLSKILYFLILRIIAILLNTPTYENGYTSKATALLNVIPIFSIYIYLTLTTVLLCVPISKHFRHMLSSCSAFLLIICILTFYIYNYTQQKAKEFMDLQLQLQKEYDLAEYYKTLFKQDENQKILIHDIRKHLISIAKLNEQYEHDKISEYLDTILNSPDLQTSVHISDNELLNSLLCHYIQSCKDNNIIFKVDVRKKLLCHLDYSDLTALFCNLLDNAMDACINIQNSYIDLSVTSKENTNITIINVVNSCTVSPTFNKSGMPVSNKKNLLKHGFGLKSVERIVNKYNGNIKMYFNNDKNTFHTIIAIEGR